MKCWMLALYMLANLKDRHRTVVRLALALALLSKDGIED